MTEPPAEPLAEPPAEPLVGPGQRPLQPWAGEPGWGVDPARALDPYPPNPYAPGPAPGFDPATGWGPGHWHNYPAMPRRPWYRAPGSLIGAATFSAVCAWLTALAALLARQIILTMESEESIEAFLFAIFAMGGLVILGAIGFATFLLTIGGIIGTVPLAVVWFRDPRRPAGPGLALAHAVVSWAVMAAAIVWIPA